MSSIMLLSRMIKGKVGMCECMGSRERENEGEEEIFGLSDGGFRGFKRNGKC